LRSRNAAPGGRSAAGDQRRIRTDSDLLPMFEGGHIHHDILAALLGTIVTSRDSSEVYEAPEYNPYVSINNMPHRIVALCMRWLFGLVSYYGPPDGIDSRPVERFQLAPEELDIKRRMLACFASQNASSLSLTRGYPHRLVRMTFERDWRQRFDFAHSYLRLALVYGSHSPRAACCHAQSPRGCSQA
jgi:hypothetical protein